MVMDGRPPHFAAARQAGRVVPAAAVLTCAVVMAGGTTAITPSVLWAPKFGFGPVITAALALAALSILGIALAGGLTILLIPRVPSGAATGLITATATSSIAEIVPGRKGEAVLVTAANVDGLSLGTIAADLLAQFVQAPTPTVFWRHLDVCAVASIAWPTVPETSSRRARGPPRIRRPSGMSRVRLFPAGGVLVAAPSGVNGSFSSLTPAFLRDDLGISTWAAPCSSVHCRLGSSHRRPSCDVALGQPCQPLE